MNNFLKVLLFSFILIDNGNAASLLDVYEQALVNDPRIKEAFANKEAIIEAKPQARSFILPQLSGSASFSDNDSDGQSTFQQKIINPINGEEVVITNNTDFLQESETLQWDVTLRQAIFDYGSWMNLRKANKTVAQAEIDYLAAEQDLIIRVANAYFNVLAAEDTLEAEQAARQAIEKQLDQAQKRFDVGLIAITDVQEAQAAYDQSIANEITSKRNLATAKESLRAITDSYPGQLNKPDNNLPLIMPNPQSESDWVETSLEQNLSYLSAQVGVEIAKSEIKVQRSGHLPTIGIQASKRDIDTDSFRSDSGSEFTPADNENINEGVGVQLNLPLYSGGQVTSRVRQAVARHRASKEKLERVARETTRIARDSYLGVISGIATVKALQQSVKSSATALQATEAGYEVGTRTTVDVLDARRRLYSSQKNLAISKYDYLKNILQLKQAAGTLTQSDLEQINNWLK
ncbi:MAG: outer membrane channel protein TolC [Gammaproteobacteria bacterium]|jgi:outer membrane protein|nr:TolC family outer membrane protein [Gammaproteobacteria bacterium]GIT36819.1 MAG: outer membrane channel protein TolC [Gammaproteobacteria bacterium]